MAKRIAKRVGGILSKRFREAFLTGRTSLSPHVAKFLSKYGNQTITDISILRTPVMSVIQKLFEQFGNLKNTDYDKLFHLSMIITLDSGKSFAIEKNEHINIIDKPVLQKSSESVRMDDSDVPDVTLIDFITNAKQYMGNKFIPYNPKHNNCQDFILGLLKGNGINEAGYIAFIKQDAQAIFNGNVWLRKLSHTVTDIADRSQLLVGRGVKRNNNAWITHVKQYANTHNISYKDAMGLAKASYY